MKLYGMPSSPNTWKVRAVAAHLGLPLAFELVDLGKGEQRSPAYLALNPTGRTPTLVDGDFALWESTAIMHYLADLKPNALWPDDARTRADILRWESWHLQHWGPSACEPLIFERFVKSFFNMGPEDEVVTAKGEEAFRAEAFVLDAHLSGRASLVGSGPTLADFNVAAPLIYATESRLPIEDYPNLDAWNARILALPAWGETAPTPTAQAA